MALALGGGVPAYTAMEGRVARLEVGQQQAAVAQAETRRDIAAMRDTLNGLRDEFREFARDLRVKK